MKSKKILLVGDDPADIETVKDSLETLGIPHSLQVAPSGVDALAHLMGSSPAHMADYTLTGKVQPDLILLNQKLPDMECLEFISIMRKYYTLKNIRIQILANAPHELDAQLLQNLGIAGYIVKESKGKSALFSEMLKKALAPEALGALTPVAALHHLKEIASHWMAVAIKVKTAVVSAVPAGIKLTALAGSAVMVTGTGLMMMGEAVGTDSPSAYVKPVAKTAIRKPEAAPVQPVVMNPPVENVTVDESIAEVLPAGKPVVPVKDKRKQGRSAADVIEAEPVIRPSARELVIRAIPDEQ